MWVTSVNKIFSGIMFGGNSFAVPPAVQQISCLYRNNEEIRKEKHFDCFQNIFTFMLWFKNDRKVAPDEIFHFISLCVAIFRKNAIFPSYHYFCFKTMQQWSASLSQKLFATL